jgi:hypothetical protein
MQEVGDEMRSWSRPCISLQFADAARVIATSEVDPDFPAHRAVRRIFQQGTLLLVTIRCADCQWKTLADRLRI